MTMIMMPTQMTSHGHIICIQKHRYVSGSLRWASYNAGSKYKLVGGNCYIHGTNGFMQSTSAAREEVAAVHSLDLISSNSNCMSHRAEAPQTMGATTVRANEQLTDLSITSRPAISRNTTSASRVRAPWWDEEDDENEQRHGRGLVDQRCNSDSEIHSNPDPELHLNAEDPDVIFDTKD